MNIRESLKQEHSKALTLRIIAYIGNDANRMAELMACFFDKEGRVSQRAAWAVGLIGAKQLQLIEPYLEQMLLKLKTPQHDAISRNTMRIMRDMQEIPNAVLGLAADVSFRFLENPSVAIAVRAFAMRVLAKVCKKEPELRDELRALIEDILEHDKAPGIVSAGKDVLKQLKKKVLISNND
jgi:hypothetical protein